MFVQIAVQQKWRSSTMIAYTEVRSQSPKGTWPKSGPDTYVMVQIVPPGVQKLISLNRKVAKKRGIVLIYCGQGYRERQATARSMLSMAKAKARRITEAINS
jgi:hypothetical protein